MLMIKLTQVRHFVFPTSSDQWFLQTPRKYTHMLGHPEMVYNDPGASVLLLMSTVALTTH